MLTEAPTLLLLIYHWAEKDGWGCIWVLSSHMFPHIWELKPSEGTLYLDPLGGGWWHITTTFRASPPPPHWHMTHDSTSLRAPSERGAIPGAEVKSWGCNRWFSPLLGALHPPEPQAPALCFRHLEDRTTLGMKAGSAPEPEARQSSLSQWLAQEFRGNQGTQMATHRSLSQVSKL